MKYVSYCRIHDLPLADPESRRRYDKWREHVLYGERTRVKAVRVARISRRLAPDAPPRAWRVRLRTLTAEVEQAEAALSAAQELQMRTGDESVFAIAAARLTDLQNAYDDHARQHPEAASEYEARLRIEQINKHELPAAQQRVKQAQRRLQEATSTEVRRSRKLQRDSLQRRFDSTMRIAEDYDRKAIEARTPGRQQEMRDKSAKARERAEGIRQRLEEVVEGQRNPQLLQAELDMEQTAYGNLVQEMASIELPDKPRMPLREATKRARTTVSDIPAVIRQEILRRYSINDDQVVTAQGRTITAETVMVKGFRIPTDLLREMLGSGLA